MAEFNKFEHLFRGGEYLPADKILSGIPLESAVKTLSPSMNTIYDELWHVTNWQNIVVNNDRTKYEKWKAGETFPAVQVATQNEFDSLVKEFYSGIEQAIALGNNSEKSSVMLDYGITVAESLEILATHNAYHLAKIVALRQLMGNWNTSGLEMKN